MRSHVLNLNNISPPVIVGGSDGSGTRAFVSILKQLGLPLVADDGVTFDLHGFHLFNGGGWPDLVNHVLEHTHSANYDFDDLPSQTQQILTTEVDKFVQETKRRYVVRLGSSRNSASKEIPYVFKAPVTMLLLPVLTKFFGRIKFLHVVRDGRDVALSANQSPVAKFYNTTYPDHLNRSQVFHGELENVRAMQLWNDWNLQANEWATRHDGVLLDYLVMRSEDLLDPSKRFECLTRLAEFVGIQIDFKKLCCLSRKAMMDFGMSHSHPIENMTKHHRNGLQMRTLRSANVRDHLLGLESKLRELHGETPNTWYRSDFVNAGNQQDQLMRRRLDENPDNFSVETFKQAYLHWKLKSSNVTFMDHQMIQRNLDVGKKIHQVWLERARLLRNYVNVSDITQHMIFLQNAADQALNHPTLDFHDTIQKRYGKWVTSLANRTELSSYLHKEGAGGLQYFGYEPRTERFYFNLSRTTFSCDDSVQCER